MRNNSAYFGFFWCFVFVVLDAVQAVFFGGVLQKHDAFLIGSLVFGISASGCILWTRLRNPQQITIGFRHPGALVGVNLSAASAWITYFISIQLVEPAVVFTIFSGVIPVATIIAWRFGVAEAQRSRNRLEAAGNLVLLAGMIVLAVITLLGWSGFVRGGVFVALAGIVLAVLSGGLFAIMLLYAQRLDRHGLGPVAQFGFRFPLFLLFSIAGYVFGLDDKGAVPALDIIYVVGVGMLLLAFPVYAVQKAISLSSSLTIGAAAALTPLIVFLLQIVEGRVEYSNATSFGLAIYFSGALLAAFGGMKSVRKR